MCRIDEHGFTKYHKASVFSHDPVTAVGEALVGGISHMTTGLVTATHSACGRDHSEIDRWSGFSLRLS